MWELFRSALWPITILVLVWLFYSPTHTILNNISRRSADIETLKLGQLEISIRPADLPSADSTIAKAIVEMDTDTILVFISLDTKMGGSYCYHSSKDSQERFSTHNKLTTLGLATMTKMAEKESWCPNPHEVRLSSLGVRVHKYLVDLLSAQVVRSRHVPAPH